jgi:hypothetical protein
LTHLGNFAKAAALLQSLAVRSLMEQAGGLGGGMVMLGGCDVDDAELFMTEVATNSDLHIDYIAGKLTAASNSSL